MRRVFKYLLGDVSRTCCCTKKIQFRSYLYTSNAIATGFSRNWDYYWYIRSSWMRNEGRTVTKNFLWRMTNKLHHITAPWDQHVSLSGVCNLQKKNKKHNETRKRPRSKRHAESRIEETANRSFSRASCRFPARFANFSSIRRLCFSYSHMREWVPRNVPKSKILSSRETPRELSYVTLASRRGVGSWWIWDLRLTERFDIDGIVSKSSILKTSYITTGLVLITCKLRISQRNWTITLA